MPILGFGGQYLSVYCNAELVREASMKCNYRTITYMLSTALVVLAAMVGCQSTGTVSRPSEDNHQDGDNINKVVWLKEGMWVRFYQKSGQSMYMQVDQDTPTEIIGHRYAGTDGDLTSGERGNREEVTVPKNEVERMQIHHVSDGTWEEVAVPHGSETSVASYPSSPKKLPE
jgi:hypothetical protein